MSKMWAGRTSGETDKIADSFNSSIAFDSRLYRHDIQGSVQHAAMLAKQGIISASDAAAITEGLGGILEDIESGALKIDPSSEDIHMFIEQELSERIGDPGRRLHTARSRNDQVALDLRMYLRDEIDAISELIVKLIAAVTDKAESSRELIMPGYTHLQRAQPVLFSHHLMAYAYMLERDLDRFSDCRRRLNLSPIGCCALAGTTYGIDRAFEAEKLGFDGLVMNSVDGVSDRDFCAEFLACAAGLMMHLSRFSEELILWSSWEFRFIELDDAYTTGSSIMPQKKNPDIAELVRGKTGRVYGDWVSLMTTLKGLPLAYNKDMQEDKEAVFDAADTVRICLEVFTPMLASMKPIAENMYEAAQRGFINATDLADHLAGKGMPFRTAYRLSGQIVAYCIEKGKTLEELSIEEYKAFDPIFEEDVFEAIDLKSCVRSRSSDGGTAPASLNKQLSYFRNKLKVK